MIFFILWGEPLLQLYISPVVKLYNKKGKMCVEHRGLSLHVHHYYHFFLCLTH